MKIVILYIIIISNCIVLLGKRYLYQMLFRWAAKVLSSKTKFNMAALDITLYDE